MCVLPSSLNPISLSGSSLMCIGQSMQSRRLVLIEFLCTLAIEFKDTDKDRGEAAAADVSLLHRTAIR